ncbi:Fur family transcriptional regulator [Chitinophaga filiformis]|uniref:Fur family transcriptional regulator, ferric uptake regulator n=1 Tax=Chitinophaga filiformis TaxID=104663 RepID=A0A1G7IW87_CHIFI|nr:transcriptional repressor [Chitinophaga filiformis]SDF16913.1 Fur family transcriptional regulator, ferric uptake regulator [Chitinophaga filiformis]
MSNKNKASITELLRASKLSITDTRVKILELFMNTNGALEHSSFEKLAGQSFDRVTVYRTLQTFLDKGIIHSIPTTDTSIRYALCKSDCSEHDHHDHHVHFKCEECGATTCLEDTDVPEINLPKGYAIHNVDVVVSGVCKQCR